MNTLNSLEINPARQLLDEIIREKNMIDDNLTKMEELLNELEKQYVEIDLIINNLKNQIK